MLVLAHFLRRDREFTTLYPMRPQRSVSLCILTLMLLSVVPALSQEFITIRGSVIDAGTGKPVPFASVRVTSRSTGTSANESGEFVVKINKQFAGDTLRISSIGYKSRDKVVASLNTYEVIALESAATELREVTVQGESALDLVKRVIAAIPEKFDTTVYHMSAFYRENNWLGKDELLYNEGVLDIRKSFKAGDRKNPTDQLRIVKSRKKKIDLGKGGILYYWLAGPANGARFSLGEDMIKYRDTKWSVFNPRNFRYYTFEYVGAISDGHRQLVIIDIKPKKKSRKALFNMRAYIDEDASTMVRYDYELTEEGVRRVEKQDKGVGYAVATVAYGVSLDYHRFTIGCSYQEYQGKWYLSSVKRHFEILVDSKKRNMDKTLWKSDILFQITGIDVSNKDSIKEGNIGDKRDRFGTLATDEYDENFWENYNVVKTAVPDSMMLPIFEADTLTRKTHASNTRSQIDLYYNSKPAFTRADTLRGKLTPLRTCYDVTFYHLDAEVDMKERTVTGSNLIRFNVVEPFHTMQVDLYSNMNIDRVVYRNKTLRYTREADAVFIHFPEKLKAGEESITIYYGGVPKVPDWSIPMDGGVLWDVDNKGNPWAQVVCQGSGASLWWPNKDHLSDEPDSMKIWITVPGEYTEISNGRLLKKTSMPGNKVRHEWYVSYPINNYNVTFNIGKYEHFSDLYISDDTLTIDYYVMPYNRALADTMFTQTKPMLAAFEKYFGKYPFPRDGFTLVETLYPMEHQSGVCLGKITRETASSHSPLLWHESAHEWWGNAVSCTDMADMWFHEAFATYAEALVVENEFGKEYATRFLKSQGMRNQYPIVGIKDVNHIHYDIGDMYGKGSLVLHTLRQVIDNDTVWFDLLHNIMKRFRYQTLTTDDLVAFINAYTKKDLTYFFDQYLKTTTIPELHYRLEEKGEDLVLHYRWQNVNKGFSMPVPITTGNEPDRFIQPHDEWQQELIPQVSVDDFEVVDEAFLIEVVEDD
jgi:hypothetical protein